MMSVGLRHLVFFSATLLFIVACSQSETNTEIQVDESAKSLNEAAIVTFIEGRMDVAFGQIWSDQQNAEQFVTDFWTPDAVAIASDGPTAWSGYGELVPLIREFMAAYPRVTAEPVYTKVVDEDVAYQFAQFNFYPADPEDKPVPAKSLYVWLKIDGQWKIAADHFSYTLMDTPTIAK